MKGRVAVNSSKTSVMAFDQFRKRVESVLGAGKRLERQPFLAQLGLKIASVPLPIGKSVLGKEEKNG